jgi:hypothetical protein
MGLVTKGRKGYAKTMAEKVEIGSLVWGKGMELIS